MDWIIGIVCYFAGAFTFIPLALWILHLYMALPQAPSSAVETVAQEVDVTTCHNYGTKKGWIRLSSNYQPKSPVMSKKKQQAKQNGEGYGVLKQGILKVYSNELQQLCEWIIDLNHYDVSIYPPGRQEHTLFSRSVALRLQRKQSAPINDHSSSTTTAAPVTIHDNVIYFSCTRSVDKEDWYFAFVSVNNTFPNALRAIPFDPMAVASLITFVGKEKHEEPDTTHPPQQRIPWFNAVLGRTFLGIYKTERLQQFIFETLAKKTKKMKSFGDIQVRGVDLGHTIPFFTNPTLVALHPDGTLVLDAQVEYNGGFKVVVEASVGGAFSIRVPLLLSLTLRSLSGTIRFKIKPPPSNRYWIGFCTMPTMKWSIVPAVSNCNVKISMVTKIIEHKIRRMMTENMVLPNMEDIPFAKSDGSGGIFHGPMDDSTSSSSSSSSTGTGLGGHMSMDATSNNDDMDSSLQQSFVINNSNDNDSSSASVDSQSASPSSGRWSKFFTTRRRKNTSSSVTSSLATPTNEHAIDKAKDKSQSFKDQQTNNMDADTTKADSDLDDVGSYNNDDIKKDNYKELDKNRADDVENSSIKHIDSIMAGPYQLSPPGTVSTLVQPSSSTSLATDSAETMLVGARGDLAKDEDSASMTSTKSSKRKRIYNAAGYIFSKGKGLANDLREYRQQDAQLSKKQPTSLQSSDQSPDTQRRYNENAPRLASSVSIPPSSSSSALARTTSEYTLTSSTAITMISAPSLRKRPIPPPSLLHNDAISLTTSTKNQSEIPATITAAASQNQQSAAAAAAAAAADDIIKPQLPPRPGHRSTTPPLSTSTSSSQQQHSETEGSETMGHTLSLPSSTPDDQQQTIKSMDDDSMMMVGGNRDSSPSSISKTTLISNAHHGYQT